MDSTGSTLIDWNDESAILGYLNEGLYEITEDPCVSAYQCWQILNWVKDIMIKTAYFSAKRFITGKSNDLKSDIGRAEGYRYLYDLYYESILEQYSPGFDDDDYIPYHGKVEITILIDEKKEVFDSIENFISYMIYTDNWFKPKRFLIKWKEAYMKSFVSFDSADTDRW